MNAAARCCVLADHPPGTGRHRILLMLVGPVGLLWRFTVREWLIAGLVGLVGLTGLM